MKTHYELLDVRPDAPADDIKKAFRREIARYHPDKVQHLGPEFQEIAATRAAELTEAYRVLMDDGLRADYDARLKTGAPPRPPTAPPQPPTAAQSVTEKHDPEAPPHAAPPPAAGDRAGAERVSSDFVRKAGASRLRDAVAAVSGGETTSVSGFDAAFDIKPKGGLFKKSEPPVRLLVRFVPLVDAAAIASAWPHALRAARGQESVCVLLLGAAGVAPAKELSAAVSEQRRKTRRAGPVMVPVDVRDWEALFPPETPSSVRAIMHWLQEGAV